MKPETSYYILSADEETWLTALTYNIWGFSKKSRWNSSNVGDYVAFYVTAPLKKIIGCGRITIKSLNEDIVWPDEKIFNKSIWKYRIEFERLYLIDNWGKWVSIPPQLTLRSGRKSVNKQVFYKFLKQMKNAGGN